jgi:outer membrane protein OmpA-like peptidoglycan-associated protein
MSLNLLDLVKDQVSGALAKEASGFLGESESSVAKALGGIVPTLLGSAVEKASKPDGANALSSLIGGLDLDNLSNIAGIFGGGAEKVNGLMNSGGGILDSLLGSKSSGVVDLIAGMAGLKSGSTSSLLKMAAPLLMGFLGNKVKGQGAGALLDLLMGSKSSIASALPSGMGSLLGLSSFGDLGDSAKSTGSVSSSASTSSSSTSYGSDGGDSGGGMGWLKWALPLALLAGLGWFLSQKGCKKTEVVTDAADVVTGAVDSLAGAATSVVDSAASTVASFTKKLASGFELKGAAGDGVESKLIGFIEDASKVVDKDTWFNFDRLLFDTGKATLQASSQEQLLNTAEILKAFPKVKLKIGGYTDNVGDDAANLKLSDARAKTVLEELIKLGIDKTRLTSEGYGEQHPVASNDTEEGRQQNRRIALRVTEK